MRVRFEDEAGNQDEQNLACRPQPGDRIVIAGGVYVVGPGGRWDWQDGPGGGGYGLVVPVSREGPAPVPAAGRAAQPA